MDTSSGSDRPTPSDFIRHSSSRKSASYHSRSSGSGSVRESNFGDTQMKPMMKFGSRRSDSDGMGLSRKEISDEDARFIYINDPAKTNENYGFAANTIRTSKYTIITFLPRNLFEQFHRVAYIYFLVIAILNQLPMLAVFGQATSIMPLAFVLLVSAIKDGYEDFRRHQADRVENNRLASVLVNGSFQQKKWKHIQVGEIIKVSSSETLPCDIVLLSTSDPTGVAYVQTINLDGESNLKTRYAKQETLSKKPEEENIGGVIKCEKPNRNIYGFLANMEIDGKSMSLGPTNIILRGCELKNTDWAIGVVVYAGPETKAMLNSSGAPSKRSRLEIQMNREIILLSAFLVALCTTVSTLAAIWLVRHKDRLSDIEFYHRKTYADEVEDYQYHGLGLEIFFTFLMCVIVFQIMIPISLYISVELVRVGQVYFMMQDDNMYDEATKSHLQCRALNINEDLGQIRYVFSDKTGTLTENKMEFRSASIWGVDYSYDDASDLDELDAYSVEVDGQVLRPKMKVKVDAELQRLATIGMDEGKHIYDFFLALAACNTIVPIITDSTDGDPNTRIIDYQGESPDEQALAFAAAAYGFVLIERSSGHIIIDIHGERQRFDVLGLHEFDSDRKRMSVILGCPDKSVKLFVKGADTNMLSVIDKSLKSNVIGRTKSHLHKYASCGLRTLVVGMRELSALEFQQWQSSYESANAALIGRAARLREVSTKVETKVSILGATAIEDKLQKGVPEAIESLRNAGIKVWVLTGDKQETAISIGYSSKLLTGEMTQVIINGKTSDSCRRYLKEALASLKQRRSASAGQEASLTASNALIIDGTSLVYILDSDLEEELFEVASYCSAVLCCRTAPLQKAGVVSLIKSRTDDMTLAIGDGANDVSMIQEADVGVGIRGQEGRQAVMASDFAIGQFRFLVPLLLVHGHWNYQRIAYMLLYNFYKNAVLVFVLFWYPLFTAYTLTSAISDWSSVLYSIIYTSLPTIVVGILDQDLQRTTLLTHTRLYGPGQRQECYNTRLFWLTMIDTLWQSVAIFFIPLLAFWKTDIDVSGLGDLWTLAVVITVNLRIAMDVMCWNWIIHLTIWKAITATAVCIFIIDAVPSLPGYWAIYNMAFIDNKGAGLFWLCLLAIPIVSLMPRFLVMVFRQYLCPTDVQLAREAEKFGKLRHWDSGETEMGQLASNSPQI